MTDYFAVLGIERRPVVNGQRLKEIYFQRSGSLHPDRGPQNQTANDQLSSVNAAFQVLHDPAARLQHLLKLEFDGTAATKLDKEVCQIFGRLAPLLQRADRELNSLSAEKSPLLRAFSFQQLGSLCGDLEQMEKELSCRRSALLEQLNRLDTLWIRDKSSCCQSLAQIALDLKFIQKWLSQVGERRLKLEELRQA